MALSFKCKHCQLKLISEYLKVGEEMKCYSCGGLTIIPDNADVSSASTIKKKRKPKRKKTISGELKNKNTKKHNQSTPISFIQAIQLGFENYINFKGRASRSEYNYWFLFATLVYIFAEIIDPIDYDNLSSGGLSFFIALLLYCPGLSVGVRRLHDINKSGWNLAWALTIIGCFPLIYWLYFKPSDNGNNYYGSNPFAATKSSKGKSQNDSKPIYIEPSGSKMEHELKTYKKMLDDDLITQEDYDAKKKQILGL